ncbi:MAG: hypothetical protein ACOZCO_07335 [Bacteroidota bacterium]
MKQIFIFLLFLIISCNSEIRSNQPIAEEEINCLHTLSESRKSNVKLSEDDVNCINNLERKTGHKATIDGSYIGVVYHYSSFQKDSAVWRQIISKK